MALPLVRVMRLPTSSSGLNSPSRPHFTFRVTTTPPPLLMSLWDIVNEDTIRESMSHFQAKKTPGPDGFKPVLLLHLPPNVLGVLCVIYRSCLYLQYTPRLWKECTVIFLPKPGKSTYSQLSSYRPISLSNYLLKTLEQLCSWHVEQCVRLNPIHPCLLYTSPSPRD